MVECFARFITTKAQILKERLEMALHALPVLGRHLDDNANANDNDNDCSICMAQSRDVAFVPCGHVPTCADCAAALRVNNDELRCPICRSLTSSTLKIYF